MNIAIDVDGVVRDFVGALTKVYLQEYPNHKDYVKPVQTWGLHKYFPIGKDIYDFAYDKRVKEVFYEEATPYDGVIEGLEKLKEMGHSLIFLTHQNKKSAEWTIKWIQYYEIPYTLIDIVYENHNGNGSNGKEHTDYDIYIDDSPDNIERLVAAGKHVVRMVRPWNEGKNLGEAYAVNKFEDFVNYVKDYEITGTINTLPGTITGWKIKGESNG